MRGKSRARSVIDILNGVFEPEVEKCTHREMLLVVCIGESCRHKVEGKYRDGYRHQGYFFFGKRDLKKIKIGDGDE
jgi:hypothetical protein